MNCIVTSKSPKGWLRNVTLLANPSCVPNWYSLNRTLLQSCFALKLSGKVLIFPLMPPQSGPKIQCCDFANNAGRYSKMKKATRGLSAIAELLVTKMQQPSHCLNCLLPPSCRYRYSPWSWSDARQSADYVGTSRCCVPISLQLSPPGHLSAVARRKTVVHAFVS